MQKEVELILLVKLIMHIAISYLPNAIPLSTLFAVIYVLGKLSEDSEMIAMRSFGYSKYRLFAPFFVIGTLISLAVFSLNQNITSQSQKAFKIGAMRLTSKSLLNNIKKNEFSVDIPYTTFYAEDLVGKEYQKIFINRNKAGEEKEIVAKRGIFIKQKYDDWGAGLLRMKLYDGNIVEFSEKGDALKKILFKEYEFPIMDGHYIQAKTGKLTTLSTNELLKQIKNTKIVKKNKRLVKLKVEYWERINNALLPLLFIFLGFSLGIKQGRGQGKNSAALAFSVIILYYTLFFTGVSMANKFIISAELAVFFPGVTLLGIGVFNFRKLNWLS